MTYYFKKYISLFTLSLFLALLVSLDVMALTITATKKGSIEIKGSNIFGTASLGINKADDGDVPGVDIKKRVKHKFLVSGKEKSLMNESLTATNGAAIGKSTVNVGTAITNDKDNIDVPFTITASATVPDNSKAKSVASASGKVRLDGKLTRKSINGLTFKTKGKLKKFETFLDTKGLVLDPIHLVAKNLKTGETIDSDIYSNRFEAQNGGGVGFNTHERLELSLIDSINIEGSFAEFYSETLVSYATDLSGSARLENGILTVSGLLNPKSNNLMDFWDLTFSSSVTNSSFITKAILKDNILDLGILTIFPEFIDLTTSNDDIIDISLSIDEYVEVSSGGRDLSIPEPPSIFLILIGVIGFITIHKKSLSLRTSSFGVQSFKGSVSNAATSATLTR